MIIKKYIKKHQEELIEVLRELIKYNSIYKPGEFNTPFGIENKKCLEKALFIGESYGLKAKNLDNYCGYLEIGTGKELIGIIAHLDIVPAGNGWNSDPFSLTKSRGYLYGRGTSDDKGAASAALIALKIIKDLNIDLNSKRVRLVLGCNEENGSRCIKYYNEKEPSFKYAFTPDGDFPCINGEKGQINCSFKCNNTTIIEIKGGDATNIVPNRCLLKLKENSYDRKKLIEELTERKLSVTITTNNNIDEIIVLGKSAHASTPNLGINAITNTIFTLKQIGFKDYFVDYYCKLFDLDNNGSNININYKDKYGSLTIVNSTLSKENNEIVGTIDIRTPITANLEHIIEKLTSYSGIEIKIDSKSNPLYYKEDHILIKRLMKAYQTVTHDYKSKPKQIGGSTYAKNISNCVAFGCEFADDNNIHNINERVKISELLLQVELYIYAIMELVK